MLSSETAAKLKSAGFPYKWEAEEAPENSWGMVMNIPTLPELIEACGDDFTELYKISHWFVAGSKSKGIESPEHDSPEEAVAALWLSLNKK